uniref:Uncharacterized protein n=1 Tax=Anguilla anguilla TaxID=7936 RepID=A0A0E9V1I8_ANGAN
MTELNFSGEHTVQTQTRLLVLNLHCPSYP